MKNISEFKTTFSMTNTEIRTGQPISPAARNFYLRTGCCLSPVFYISNNNVKKHGLPKPCLKEQQKPIKATNLVDFAVQLANS